MLQLEVISGHGSILQLFFVGGRGGFCFLLSVCCLSLHFLWYWIICCPKGWQGTCLIGLLSPGMPNMVPRTSVFVRVNGPDSKHLLRGKDHIRQGLSRDGCLLSWELLVVWRFTRPSYSNLHLRVTLHWPGDKSHRGWSAAAQLILLSPSSWFVQK